MPLTIEQSIVSKLLIGNRSVNSYAAAGTVMAVIGSRFPADLDFHHPTMEQMLSSMDADLAILRREGYRVEAKSDIGYGKEFLVWLPDREPVVVDWTYEVATGHYPAVEDAVCGFRTHTLDAAAWKVEKALERQAAKDFYDLVEIDRKYVPLHVAIYMAARGKGSKAKSMLKEIASFAVPAEADVLSIRSIETISYEGFKGDLTCMIKRATIGTPNDTD